MRTTSTGSSFLLFLSALVAFVTILCYRSILHYDVIVSIDLDNSFAPPPKRYDAILSHTKIEDDAPYIPKKINENNNVNGNNDYEAPLMKKTKGAKSKKRVRTAGEIETTEAATSAKAKDNTIRIRDFVPIPPPAELLAESKSRTTQIDFYSIATRWELPDGSIDLLKQIQSRRVGFDYNRTTDVLSLRHPLKTGGTSFSWMMLEIFKDRVIPGSGPSNWWQEPKFNEALELHDIKNKTDPYWNNMAVLYTHTFLRPTNGGRKNKFLEELRDSVPALQEKRFRLMTIVRRPLDLAASSFYETQCRIGRFAKQRNLKGGICPPVNLTDVMIKNIEFWSNKCEKENGWGRGMCKNIKEKGGEIVFGHCGSIDYLMDKTENVHNMAHRSMMGDFPRPPELGDDDSIGINLTPTLKDVSLHTLRDLGGLIDYNPDHKEDFIWFAVTERFSESMCLFYYYFEVEPVKEKTSLMKPCRPLTFWTESQKKKYISKEDFSYTVWRAANAILDVRMKDMRLQIKGRLDAGEKLADMPFVGSGCYIKEETTEDEEESAEEEEEEEKEESAKEEEEEEKEESAKEEEEEEKEESAEEEEEEEKEESAKEEEEEEKEESVEEEEEEG